MKFRSLLLALAVVAGPLCSRGQMVGSSPAVPSPSAPPTAAEIEEMFQVYGWVIGDRVEISAFELSDKEFAAFVRGLKSRAQGEPPPENIQTVGPRLQQYVVARAESVQQKRVDAGKSEQAALFAKLDTQEKVNKTASGLRYEILDAGTGARPAAGDTVVAHYTGTFVDGTVFDSSHERGEPAEFALNNVVQGWQEGLPLIGAGGHIKLYVPYELGYGESGARSIPPAKALIFDVELISVRPPQPKLSPSATPLTTP